MIRLLIDENLPASLAAVLPVDCVHATETGGRPSDRELWDFARAANLVILTRDADFFDRLTLEGPPPKVVWIRLGNVRRRELEGIVAGHWSGIENLLNSADLVEVHPGCLETLRFARD